MARGLVTGRQYKKTRPRGWADWRPQEVSLKLLKLVGKIIKEYGRALTARQVFYRLVGKHDFDKTEKAYGNLLNILGRARRAGLIPMHAIRDDTASPPRSPWSDGPEDFWDMVRYFAKGYVRRPMGPTLVEIWVEAAGMIPQIEAVAHPFGVKVMGTGGFDSLTAHHATAQRLLTEAGDRPILVLLIGDLDPSGGSIMDSGAEDVAAFSGEHPAQFVRLAVTPEQVQEHNLDTAPQKEKDIRGEHMDETVQAEALDPGVLAQIVTARLTDLVPQDAIDEAARLTEQEKAEILEQLPEPSDDEEEDPDE